MENKEILYKIKSRLASAEENCIDKIILFGSQANGSADDDSDFDILILLNRKIDWQEENKILNLCNEIDLELDILTDIKFFVSADLETIKGKQPFIQNALKFGLAV